MRYHEAMTLACKARNRVRGYRLPGREGRTRLVIRSNGVAVRYTKTTLDRMGYAEQVNVFTVLGEWFVTTKGQSPWGTRCDKVWQFSDGMRFNKAGTICLNELEREVSSYTRLEFLEHVRQERNKRARQRRALRQVREIENKVKQDTNTMGTEALEFLKTGG